jgi:hypothetical protein
MRSSKVTLGQGATSLQCFEFFLTETTRATRNVSLVGGTQRAASPVFLSGNPMLRGDGLFLLSLGNRPLVPAPGDGQPHPLRWLPFEAWVNADSLIVPSSQKRHESWGTFATLVAKTDGAYLSTVYHDFLETSHLFYTLWLSLRDFLLRQTGWQVEQVLAQVLASVGRSLLPCSRRVNHWPRMPIWMHFLYQPGVCIEVAVSVNVSNDDPRPVEIMRFS